MTLPVVYRSIRLCAEELAQGIKFTVALIHSRQKASKLLTTCAQMHDVAYATGKEFPYLVYLIFGSVTEKKFGAY